MNYVLLAGMEELDRRESFEYDRPDTWEWFKK